MSHGATETLIRRMPGKSGLTHERNWYEANNAIKTDARTSRGLWQALAPMNRAATLEALVKISMPISEAISRLAEFPWDSESELVLLTPEDFCHVLSVVS